MINTILIVLINIIIIKHCNFSWNSRDCNFGGNHYKKNCNPGWNNWITYIEI